MELWTTRRGLFTATATALFAAACSADPKPKPSVTPSASTTSGPSPSASASPSPTATVTLTGGDAGLRAVVSERYARTGGTGEAVTGTWKGQDVAVVTIGDDVTLATGSAGTWQVVGGWWPSLGVPDADLGGGPQFLLALGSDARPGEPPYGMRSDTIQILGIDGQGGGGVMGLARDLWAPMPGGRGEAKINAALPMGGGAGALESIGSLTGLPLAHYATTSFEGMAAIVDGWGGIPVLVDQTVNAGAVVPAGFQVLNGAQALSFARARKELPDGDFGRSRHQGDLIMAAAVKARTLGVRSIPSVLSLVDAHCDSNLPADQALRFGAAFYRLDPTKVGRHVVQGPFGWSRDKQSIVLVGDASRAKLAEFASGRLS